MSGNVFVLDEAHNVEDVCRQSASVEVSDQMLLDIHQETLTFIDDPALLGEELTECMRKLNYMVACLRDMFKST